MILPRNRRWLIVLTLVFVAGVLLFVAVYRLRPPAVTYLPPTPLKVKSGRVPDRWIPAKWVWLQRLCRRVFGPPRQVVTTIETMEYFDTVAAIIAKNSLGQPQAETNGVAIWIVPDSFMERDWISGRDVRWEQGRNEERKLTRLTTGLILPSFRMYGMESTLRLRKETIELSVRLIVTKEQETNFVAAVRAQLPYGKALLNLDVRQPDSQQYRSELVIAADECDNIGNWFHRSHAINIRGASGP